MSVSSPSFPVLLLSPFSLSLPLPLRVSETLVKDLPTPFSLFSSLLKSCVIFSVFSSVTAYGVGKKTPLTFRVPLKYTTVLLHRTVLWQRLQTHSMCRMVSIPHCLWIIIPNTNPLSDHTTIVVLCVHAENYPICLAFYSFMCCVSDVFVLLLCNHRYSVCGNRPQHNYNYYYYFLLCHNHVRLGIIMFIPLVWLFFNVLLVYITFSIMVYIHIHVAL